MFTALLLTSGCEPGNLRQQGQEGAPPDVRAVLLYNSGQFEQAAVEYLELAQRYRTHSLTYRLAAADAYIRVGKFDQAESIISDVAPRSGQHKERFYRDLLTARIALGRGRPDLAESLMQQQIPEDASGQLLADWYSTQAELYEMQNRHSEALLARALLEAFLDDPELVEDNANRLWEHLNLIDTADINSIVDIAPSSLRPWLELVALNRARQSGNADSETALKTWAATYPDHPANRSITARILATGKTSNSLPGHIALLLPLTGIYESYSEKIRDGFLSAWFEETSYRPVVRIYDTDAANVSEVYQNAIEAGAEFVVGPLQKEAVRILANMRPMPVRTLALNQVDTPQTDPDTSSDQTDRITDLVQFGLPPEDEAREVARRGIIDGHSRVLIITVADEFGDRVAKAFSEEWISLGGKILERVDYNGLTEDFIAPIKQLLNIDSSEARIALLRQRLGRNLNVNGRLRNDTDFIFMVASNLTARQIVPHLRFFRADAIPVYSISNIYNGIPDPLTDVDLDGVEFVDMPWLLGIDTDGRMVAGRPPYITSLPRYYAFGIDAFRLISQISRLAQDSGNHFSGATGKLYLTDEGMVRRNLSWARFVDGQPQTTETDTLSPR